MVVLISGAVLVHPSTHLPGALASLGDQNQTVKTTLYLVAFLIVLPLSVLGVPRIADRLRDGANGACLGLLSALLAATLTLAVVFARASAGLPWGDGAAVVFTAGCCWWLLAGAMVARGCSSHPWGVLLRALPFTGWVVGVAAVGAFGAVLSVTRVGRLSVIAIVAGGLGASLVVRFHHRIPLPRLAGRMAVVAECVIAIVLVLAIPDLNPFTSAGTPILTHFNDVVIADQENYLLGPANQLLAGGTMLVNTFSQYGVGSIYFLAGWFHLAPIGYGTLGFLDGVLTAFCYLAAYLVLRLAGVSRLLASCSLALGVIALVYNLMYPVGALAEHGPLRFGVPMAALLVVTVGLRVPRWAGGARRAAAVLLALASLWSIEAFAYTVLVLGAMATVSSLRRQSGTRRTWLVRQVGLAAGAVAAVQIIFALATLVESGQLPNWGEYFAYFESFLTGSMADLTYGFARWSPGLAVATIYLASAIAIVLVVSRMPTLLRHRPVVLTVLAGSTAYGIALFSYFDNRSATYLVLYVALPALITVTLWLGLALDLTWERGRAAARGILAFALALAVIVLAAAWSPVSARFSDSALAYVVPGGPSLGSALHNLWHPPQLDSLAAEGQRLLARYMPGESHTLVFTIGAPDLGTEILIRSRRGNRLPFGDPVEDSILPSDQLPALRRTVATLRAGERLLLNTTAASYVRRFRAGGARDPLRTSDPEAGTALEEWALERIAQRFDLRTITSDGRGLTVAVLEPRR